MVILFFPVLVLGISFSLQFDSVVHFASSAGVLSVLTYLLSQLGRDLGKTKEKELWESWGGAPSIQLLRFHNSEIDHQTKKRYRQKLIQWCPVDTPLDLTNENRDVGFNDVIYGAWTKFLIAKTRDPNVFPLLLKENTSYGFRRNLWALKQFAVTLIVVLWVGMYLYVAHHFRDYAPINFPNSFWYATIGLGAILLFWLIVVTREWVRVAAFAYAHRLCESIDQLQK